MTEPGLRLAQGWQVAIKKRKGQKEIDDREATYLGKGSAQ